jgi:hypothetical protein
LHILKDQIKKKKIVAKKLNSKWLSGHLAFKMVTKTKFAHVAKKTLVALGLLTNSIMFFNRFWAGKKYKKYLEAPKLKMATQFKMLAKI